MSLTALRAQFLQCYKVEILNIHFQVGLVNLPIAREKRIDVRKVDGKSVSTSVS